VCAKQRPVIQPSKQPMSPSVSLQLICSRTSFRARVHQYMSELRKSISKVIALVYLSLLRSLTVKVSSSSDAAIYSSFVNKRAPILFLVLPTTGDIKALLGNNDKE